MPSFDASKAGYANLWRAAQVERTAEAAAVAKAIIADRERYEAAAARIGHETLWPLIGAIHQRESNRSFSTHLHNGDSLKGYTHRVPAGRPQVGHGPPFTWEESADDALRLKGWEKIAAWPLERWLYEAERYNGWGYLGRINSPYLWAGTSKQQPGKYIRDHVFDPRATDRQLGIVAMLKAVFDFVPEAEPESVVAPPPAQPPIALPAALPDAAAALREVISAVLPVIEREYVVLTKAQFTKLVTELKGASLC